MEHSCDGVNGIWGSIPESNGDGVFGTGHRTVGKDLKMVSHFYIHYSIFTGARIFFTNDYKNFAPVPAACSIKNCFMGPIALIAFSPMLLSGTRGPLSTEYNLCNLSTTPSSTWFAAYLSELYGSKDICTPMSCPWVTADSIVFTKLSTSPCPWLSPWPASGWTV